MKKVILGAVLAASAIFADTNVLGPVEGIERVVTIDLTECSKKFSIEVTGGAYAGSASVYGKCEVPVAEADGEKLFQSQAVQLEKSKISFKGDAKSYSFSLSLEGGGFLASREKQISAAITQLEKFIAAEFQDKKYKVTAVRLKK